MLDLRRVYGLIEGEADRGRVEDLAWEGSFGEYLSLVLEIPRVARSARQRFHGMLVESVESFGGDASTEAESVPLSRAEELLARVTSELSGIARGQAFRRCGGLVVFGEDSACVQELFRLLRERAMLYSRRPQGALFTLRWALPRDGGTSEEQREFHECPVREEPLRLVPPDSRKALLAEINEGIDEGYPLAIDGPPCPFCRQTQDALLKKYHGDWSRMAEHIRVHRLPLSGDDGVGGAAVEVDSDAGAPRRGDELPADTGDSGATPADIEGTAESGSAGLLGLERANRGLAELTSESVEMMPWVAKLLDQEAAGGLSTTFEGSRLDAVVLWGAADRDALDPQELAAVSRQAVVLDKP